MADNRCWMVRAGEGGYLFDDFKINTSVAIGWNEIGAIEENDTVESIKSRLRKTYPDLKEGNIISSANQIYKFANVFCIGDHIVTYDRSTRTYLIGTVSSEYIFDDVLEYCHRRQVSWIGEKLRDELDPGSKNSLGSTLTIFEITPEVLSDLLETKGDNTTPRQSVLSEEEELEEIKDDVVERAHEFIKDKLIALSWDKMHVNTGEFLPLFIGLELPLFV